MFEAPLDNDLFVTADTTEPVGNIDLLSTLRVDAIEFFGWHYITLLRSCLTA